MPLIKDHPFGILTYHRVTEPPAGVVRPPWNVTPARFRRQLQGLLARGYRPWPLSRVLACRLSGEPVPEKIFVITFDDGYQCVYDNAWPVLKELSAPATIFVVTGYLDSDCPLPSDDWSAAGSVHAPASTWRSLSTRQCAEMIEHGLIEIGSHTHTHADFRGQADLFSRDLAVSLETLRCRFDLERPAFAFPFGHNDAELTSAVRQSGVVCALTAEPELVPPGTDLFTWGRLTVFESDSALTLALKLTGWYGIARAAWHWLRRPWQSGNGSVGVRTAGLWERTNGKINCP